MVQRKELLVDTGRMYALTSDDASKYLEVMCGGLAMEMCVVRLTQDEVLNYEQEGKEYLDTLAGEIARNRSRFADRTVK